jgi:hypothetical protein
MVRKYRPSSGTEGIWFTDTYCSNCIHGKYEHTADINDKPCEILTRSFFCDINDKDYPEEWQYTEDDRPVCTAFRKWDWGRDDDGNFKNPEPPPADDPNQLCMPFIFDEIGVSQNIPEKDLVVS